MILASAASDIAIVMGALGVLIASIATSIVTVFGQRKIRTVVEDTHAQVVTLNESTIGELAAADETRRAEGIPYGERTKKEQEHIDTAPRPGPAQGPPQTPMRLADRLAHVEQVGDETRDRVEQVVPIIQQITELVRAEIDAALADHMAREEVEIRGHSELLAKIDAEVEALDSKVDDLARVGIRQTEIITETTKILAGGGSLEEITAGIARVLGDPFPPTTRG